MAGNTVIAAAGRVTHGRVVKAAARHARRLAAGPRPAFEPVRNGQREPKVHLFTKATEQTQLALGIHTCSRHDDRRHAVRVLNAILGENMSSRLFQVLREDRGLAYSIYSTPSFFEDAGDLVIAAGLDTDNVTKALAMIMRELRRLIETPPAAAELRRAREYLIGQADLSLESTDNQMNWIGEQWLGYGRIASPAAVKRRLNQVTAAEVRAVARDFFRPERLNLAVVSPLKSDRTLKKGLGAL